MRIVYVGVQLGAAASSLQHLPYLLTELGG